MSTRKTREVFIQEARKIHGNRYDYSRVVYKSRHKKVTIICKEHGIFRQKPGNHAGKQRSGCPRCGIVVAALKRATGIDLFIRQARKVHGGSYDYSWAVYVSTHKKIRIFCRKPNHGTFRQNPHMHLLGQGCPLCGLLKKSESLKLESRDLAQRIKKGWKTIEVLTTPIGVNEKCSLRCKICNCCWSAVPNSLVTANGKPKQGCPDCGYKRRANRCRKSLADFIYQAKQIHGRKYDYSKVVYINTHTVVQIGCKVKGHGFFRQTPNAHVGGQKQGCPMCWESRGEKAVATFLDKLHFKYEREKVFATCRCLRMLRFDFYVPGLRLLVEYQGEQHSFPVRCWGGLRAFRGVQKRDKIKREWAGSNGYEFIAIKHTQSVEEVLTARLNGKRRASQNSLRKYLTKKCQKDRIQPL